MDDLDVWGLMKKSSNRWTDSYDERFSNRRPASVVEAFERSIMNGEAGFEYERTRYQNTMPGCCIQVIGHERTVRRFTANRPDFLRSGDRIMVAEDWPESTSFTPELQDSIASLSLKTTALSPFVVVSNSALNSRCHHFTLYLADRRIEGAASFNPVLHENLRALDVKRRCDIDTFTREHLLHFPHSI